MVSLWQGILEFAGCPEARSNPKPTSPQSHPTIACRPPRLPAALHQALAAGHLDTFALLACCWAAHNAVAPALFFVYLCSRGATLRWCCAAAHATQVILICIAGAPPRAQGITQNVSGRDHAHAHAYTLLISIHPPPPNIHRSRFRVAADPQLVQPRGSTGSRGRLPRRAKSGRPVAAFGRRSVPVGSSHAAVGSGGPRPCSRRLLRGRRHLRQAHPATGLGSDALCLGPSGVSQGPGTGAGILKGPPKVATCVRRRLRSSPFGEAMHGQSSSLVTAPACCPRAHCIPISLPALRRPAPYPAWRRRCGTAPSTCSRPTTRARGAWSLGCAEPLSPQPPRCLRPQDGACGWEAC
jgi:hypothetical protein